jgi:hypothetical protein
MALITWTSKYSVGVEALDNQNKALMRVLIELHAASMREEALPACGISPVLKGHDFSRAVKPQESIGL